MTREQIEAMLAEQDANLKRLQDTAQQVVGARAVLREILRRMDEAEAQAAEETSDGE